MVPTSWRKQVTGSGSAEVLPTARSSETNPSVTAQNEFNWRFVMVDTSGIGTVTTRWPCPSVRVAESPRLFG
jgi:hypothetical protein